MITAVSEVVLEREGGRHHLPPPQQHRPQVVERVGIGRIERHRPLIRHDRLVALPIPLEQSAKQEVRCGIERILLDRDFHLEGGFVRVAPLEIRQSGLVVRIWRLQIRRLVLGGRRLEAGGKNRQGKDDSQPSRDEHFLHRVCHLLRGLRLLRKIAPSLSYVIIPFGEDFAHRYACPYGPVPGGPVTRYGRDPPLRYWLTTRATTVTR
jgi:hypothetical protein